MQFDNCRIESAVYTGDFHIGDRSYYIESVNRLAITTDTDTEIDFQGIISDAATRYHYGARDINATITTPFGEWQLEYANNQYSFPHLSCCYSGRNFLSNFDGSFLLRSPNTGNQLVNAETLLPFDYNEPLPGPADWNYRTGVLSVTADDGSRMILNADSGDDDTVSIQLINGDEVDEFEQTWMLEWSVWQQVLLRLSQRISFGQPLFKHAVLTHKASHLALYTKLRVRDVFRSTRGNSVTGREL